MYIPNIGQFHLVSDSVLDWKHCVDCTFFPVLDSATFTIVSATLSQTISVFRFIRDSSATLKHHQERDVSAENYCSGEFGILPEATVCFFYQKQSFKQTRVLFPFILKVHFRAYTFYFFKSSVLKLFTYFTSYFHLWLEYGKCILNYTSHTLTTHSFSLSLSFL